MNNKGILPTTFEPYLFDDIHGSISYGWYSINGSYATNNAGAFWSETFLHEANMYDPCDYGFSFRDGRGNGYMLAMRHGSTPLLMQNITFRFDRLKQRILESWEG